jgi:hypothetical protein
MAKDEGSGNKENPELKDVEPGSDADATPVEPLETTPGPKENPRDKASDKTA